jgi:hypothetical protein
VLDNCEHVIGAAAELCAGLLGACDDVKILATSREPLAVAGEARYRLALPDLEDLAGAAGAEAVVLFADRGTLLASMAIGPAAWAEIPADGGSAPIQPPAVAAAGGMPGWQITLIALGAALVAATAAVLLDRARAARSTLSPRRGAFRQAARS